MSESKIANDILVASVENSDHSESVALLKDKLRGLIIPADVMDQPTFDTILTIMIFGSTDMDPYHNGYSFYRSLIQSMKSVIVSRTDFRIYHSTLNTFVHHFKRLNLNDIDEYSSDLTIAITDFVKDEFKNINTIFVAQESTLYNDELNKLSIPMAIGDISDIESPGNIISQAWIIMLLKFANGETFKRILPKVINRLAE